MKRQIKLTSQEQTEIHAAAEQTSSATPLEFASPELMLRHDAMHTPVPPGIAQRLQKSLSSELPADRSWWQRWFGSAS
jgi:hypothetical protein